MEKRDLIKDEIERLGKVLGKIVADLLNLKAEGEAAQAVEEAEKALKVVLDFDIPSLLKMPEAEFITRLKANENLHEHRLEQIGDIFLELGETRISVGDREEAKSYLQKSLMVYEYITQSRATYSFEREEKVSRALRLLQ